MRAARIVFALSGVIAAAWAIPAPAQTQSFFHAESTATAIHFTATQDPPSSLITASLVDDALAYASSAFDSGSSSEALAASAFPGRLVVQGPQLLCTELFPCPVSPPRYPLLADASYPRQRTDTADVHGSAMGSGPLVVTPLAATAHAGSSGNGGQTASSAMTLLAGTPAQITIGSSAASSVVTSGGNALTLHVTSTASDIDVGGVLHIGSVRAIDDITLHPGQRPVDHPAIAVSGVTVAGQSATVDNRGVHVAGQTAGSVSQQLSAIGVSIRTVGVHRGDGRAAARSDATALSISFAVPVSGLPYIPNPVPPLPPPFDQIPTFGVNGNGTYIGHLTLGEVGAAASVGHEPTFGGGGGGGGQQQPPPTKPSTSGPAPASAPLPATGPQLVQQLSKQPTQTPPAIAPAPRSLLRAFFDLISKQDVETLYAVLALGTFALFIGWRAAVLSRMRGRGRST